MIFKFHALLKPIPLCKNIMPNDCWNHLTITASKEELTQILDDERFKAAPEWALKIKDRGVQGVVLNLWSRWQPDFEWLEGLIEKYKTAWIKNQWNEEGGCAGIWIGSMRTGEKIIKELDWEDLCLEEGSYLFRKEDK